MKYHFSSLKVARLDFFLMNQVIHLIQISSISGKILDLRFPFFNLEMISASRIQENSLYSQLIKQTKKQKKKILPKKREIMLSMVKNHLAEFY